MRGNEKLHIGTFSRLANNPWFNLTHDETMGFLAWKGGKPLNWVDDLPPGM